MDPERMLKPVAVLLGIFGFAGLIGGILGLIAASSGAPILIEAALLSLIFGAALSYGGY